MTTTKPKQVDGAIQDMTPTPTNPTSVQLAGKTIYLPPNTRALFNSQEYKIGEVIRLRYDRDGNYINSERLPREAHQIAMNGGGGEKHTQFEPEHPCVHIQPETLTGTTGANGSVTGNTTILPKIENMHIQKTSTPAHSQEPHWLTEREKNDTIVLQSLLARSVEILDSLSRDYPEFINHRILQEKDDFEKVLINRCDNIEFITNRLFEYMKKKVSDEQKKGTV